MKKKRAIAISPTPECICLAACCRPGWDVLHTAGNRYILNVLEDWRQSKNISSAIILLAGDIAEPDKVATLIKDLAADGVRLRWFCGSGNPNINRACSAADPAGLIAGKTLRDAMSGHFSTGFQFDSLLDQLKDNDDLLDFIRYKVSISFMKGYDSEPVYEAVKAIGKNGDKRFGLDMLNAHDAASVQNFRDAEFPQLDGKSQTIMNLKKRIQEIGATELSTLIIGETGTGKEAIAFYLHEFSPRRNRPFLPINCAALDENFLRSELFGHEKNAFTGAGEQRDGLVKKAEGGTIFLDELADMSLPIQADLLRFLQTKRFRRLGGTAEHVSDVRVVAASQPSILEKIKSGEFRADLYFRIAEVEIKAPKLMDIPDDIIRIIRSIGFRHTKDPENDEHIFAMIDYFNNGAELLRKYHWPGNVRELAGYVKRRLLLGDDVLLEMADGIAAREAEGSGVRNGLFPRLLPDISINNAPRIDELVRSYVRHADSCFSGASQQEIARKLGVSVNTYKKYLKNI